MVGNIGFKILSPPPKKTWYSESGLGYTENRVLVKWTTKNTRKYALIFIVNERKSTKNVERSMTGLQRNFAAKFNWNFVSNFRTKKIVKIHMKQIRVKYNFFVTHVSSHVHAWRSKWFSIGSTKKFESPGLRVWTGQACKTAHVSWFLLSRIWKCRGCFRVYFHMPTSKPCRIVNFSDHFGYFYFIQISRKMKFSMKIFTNSYQ